MTRSKLFWTGAVLLAIVPLIALDIPRHYIDWRRDVRDERGYVAQNAFNYSDQQKAAIMIQVGKTNRELLALMYVKGFAVLLLLCLGAYFLYRHFKSKKNSKWKAFLTCFVLVIFTGGIKLYSWTAFSGNDEIVLLPESSANDSLNQLYQKNFKGKVVYVDFWGTYCGPCLEEFRNFTKPIKDHYKNRPDLAYLYICSGRRLIWKQQLQKFDIQGSHIFLDKENFAMLYHQSVRGSQDSSIVTPRYLIIGRDGVIVDNEAPPPSKKDSVEARLDKYLAGK